MLRRAARSRIDRMVKVKGKRVSLNVPQWLRDEWAKGCKDQIADVLRDANFDKETAEKIVWCDLDKTYQSLKSVRHVRVSHNYAR